MTAPNSREGIEEISKNWQKLGIEKCLSQMIDFHHQELQKAREERDTYWKERVRKEVDELWHDLGKYQGWLGGVMGNETDFTLMQQQPTKEAREAKALHTAIIMKAKEKVHQTQMKVKSLLDNLK